MTQTVAVAAEDGNGVRRIRLDVTGMTCGSCAARVENKLNKVDGVRASVNYATRVATIDAASGVGVPELCEVVQRAGYEAEQRPDAVIASEDDPDARQARNLLLRLSVAAVLFIPLADLSVMFAFVPSTRFTGWEWILTALAAPIVTWAAWPFHRVALRNLRHGNASMETLISIGVTAATGWSIYTIFFDNHVRVTTGVWQALLSSDAIYLEVAAGVTVFVLAGRYFEAKAKSRAGGALRALAALGAKNATVLLADGTEMVIPAAELKEGQRFAVRPGESVAADGLVIEGRAAVDVSAMTGESKPVDVEPGATVVGGTVVLDGRLVIEAAAVGPDTRFAGMVRLVEEAQVHKAEAQRIADRIASVFVPVVLVIAALTVAGWLWAAGDTDGGLDKAISAGLAVLVIACPCALGLATPTALMVASGRGAQLGIFLKGHRALEAIRAVDIVVFDKTGTLTTGRAAVTGVEAAAGWDPDEVLAVAAAAESGSEHVLASAILEAAPEAIPEVDVERSGVVEEFQAFSGNGVTARVDGQHVAVGRPAWVARGRVVPATVAAARKSGEARSETVVFVAVDDQVCGAISVADKVKDSAPGAVTALHRAGLKTMLLTGDNTATAEAIAAAVGIDDVIAEVLPEGKVDAIERLRERGHVVAMVGDGINDGPALARADLGLAIGRGTDVAIGAADIILVRESLDSVPTALGLARATMRTIRTNMAWAFGYNIAAIPIAAAGLLNPLIAGAAMALSSFLVVSNSLRLRSFAAGPADTPGSGAGEHSAAPAAGTDSVLEPARS
ncbi:heavy metal translocating P-type ATPase [Mycolicibacterium palauense]|uniref:heavy metal translocating P-type ATPase n=1 Tax=Mycolicibacterium palauense TaxID=2034511 RepID=UPI000BFEDED2|nr:heavy metal translocating P-type ATPase [Mycolicibacterium palauense]